jgi:hypothetical protein
MRHLTSGLRWAGQRLRRLRALVNDEDKDKWYEDRRSHDEAPHPGPNLGGGGT